MLLNEDDLYIDRCMFAECNTLVYVIYFFSPLKIQFANEIQIKMHPSSIDAAILILVFFKIECRMYLDCHSASAYPLKPVTEFGNLGN